MKLIIAVGIAILLTAATVNARTTQLTRCGTGHVRGFASVQGDPRLGGVGAIPNQLSGKPFIFGTRYNCTKKGVFARRVDEGVYDVQFPGNRAIVAQVTPLINGASGSVSRLSNSTWRVIIRGPIVENDILIPKEAPFNITIV